MQVRSFFCAVLSAAAMASASAAIAAPQFLAYEGHNAVRVGEGGEKKSVAGVDIWMNGAPPRRFEVLGSLTDRRFDAGLLGMVAMSGMDREIADAARKAGGDAVILSSQADARGASFADPMKQRSSRFVVVKYLAADAAWPSQPYAGASGDPMTPTPAADVDNLPAGAVARY